MYQAAQGSGLLTFPEKLVIGELTMFPFWLSTCCSGSKKSYDGMKEQQLTFLRWVRDSLETRLAAVDAAITTIERQKQTTETTQEEA